VKLRRKFKEQVEIGGKEKTGEKTNKGILAFRKLIGIAQKSPVRVILGFISAIVASILAAAIVHECNNYKSRPTITHINNISIKNCGAATNPCEVFLQDNLVLGRKGKGGEYIYLIIEDVKNKKCLNSIENLRPSGTLDIADDWADYFSIDNGNNLGVLYSIFVVQTLGRLESFNELKHRPQSKRVFIKPTRPGAYKDEKITPVHIISSPQLHADIYVGREYFKQEVISTRDVIANLYYSRSKNRVVKAEVDWGEGQGWEDVDLHRGNEYYQILHMYGNPGRKEVRYRVTDKIGQWVEARDTIEIKEGLR
jgi:hypothetical protein